MKRLRPLPLVMLFATALASAQCAAIVFWFDDRTPYGQAEPDERRKLLGAAGGIFCTDGTTGTGFVIDVSSYLTGEVNFQILVTSAKILFNQSTGFSRAICAFRPASAPERLIPIGERLAGEARVGFMDPNDWAFAKLDEANVVARPLAMDFDAARELDKLPDNRLWAVGYEPEWKDVGLTSNCRPSAVQLSTVRDPDANASEFIIHGCDLLRAAKGGPVAVYRFGEFWVVAINGGDSLEKKHKDFRALPFDPQRNFYNYARRIDVEIENKLVAFLSRFAQLKSPSRAIKAHITLVRKVQENLLRLGFKLGDIDGLLGQRTADAVQAFQTSLGITPTGRVSEELLLLLQAR